MRKVLIETLKNKGVCQFIQEKISLEWFTIDIAINLDTELYYEKSTEKYISTLYQNLLEKFDDETALEKVAENIVMKFRTNWDKIYEAYFATNYKPLENYSMTEKENIGTEIRVNNDVDNKIYGFNSVEGSNSSKSSNSVVTSSDFNENKRELTRQGNIGVTTSQQMLTSELELREYNFFEKILTDIDSVICLSTYR